MIDEHIQDGDLVVVSPRDTARNGETVVALLPDGEATLKTFYREKDRIRLQPANPAYEPSTRTTCRFRCGDRRAAHLPMIVCHPMLCR
jgi:SOS-response transcriptional repressor LexA